MGVTYKTAYRWFKAGRLDAYQLDTGTIIVREQKSTGAGIALYARVSSADQRNDLDRQVDRLKEYAIAKGYKVDKIVTEIASGLNDSRPKLSALLKDTAIGLIVVEHRDRLSRFGLNHIVDLLEASGRGLEIVFPGDTSDDLVNDFVAIITSMAARIYGKRGNKHRAERIRQCVEQVAQDESLQE
jgi:predicted site-specific integrase-resolvase